QPRADQQFTGTAEEVDVQFAATHLDFRVLRLESGQLRRVRARIDDGERLPTARQVAYHGHAALAEADNDAELVGSDQHSLLPQLQRGKADQHQYHGDVPDTYDHPCFGPALEFEMVMNGRHAEHALAGQLERGDLDHHRQGFHHEHAAHDEQHHFLRSEERRVGKECRSLWSPPHYEKNIETDTM